MNAAELLKLAHLELEDAQNDHNKACEVTRQAMERLNRALTAVQEGQCRLIRETTGKEPLFL